MKKYGPNILVIIGYCLMTCIFFRFRIVVISTHYSIPDVDTDGALWQYGMHIFSHRFGVSSIINQTIGFPFGFDFSTYPVYSLVYDLIYHIYQRIGGGYYDLIAMSNISLLVQYPLMGYAMYILALQFTKNKYIAFLGGLLFAFSFHNVLYARNSLSINRLFLIPLYFIFFMKYIRNSSIYNIVRSALVLAMVFMCNPYWAFYSMIFSPIFFSFTQGSFYKKGCRALKFYIVNLFVLVTINANFLIQQVDTQFNAHNIQVSGRGFVVGNQLTRLPSLLTRTYLNPATSERFIEYGVWLGYIGLLILFLSFFQKRILQNKIYLIFLICFLISILLAAYVPGMIGVNTIFLKLFPMFKSISRFNIYAMFFLSLIVVFVLDYRYVTYSKRKNITNKTQLLCIIACIIIIYFDSMPWGATTRLHTTDFSKIVSLYTPLRDDPHIHVIVGYPMTLYGSANVDGGVPPTYEMLGQIVHQKILVGGLDPFNQHAIAWYKSIQDIRNLNTIPLLREQGVDTIVIYNNLLGDASTIVDNLKNNPQVTYVGLFTQPIDDPSYISHKDLSQNISVFYIKNPNRSYVNIFQVTSSLTFSKSNPTKYSLSLHLPANSTGTNLSFLQSFHPEWKLYVDSHKHSFDTGDCTTGSSQNSAAIASPMTDSQQSGQQIIASGTLLHTVVTGDNLRKIAQQYPGMTLEKLALLNSGTYRRLEVGQRIIIALGTGEGVVSQDGLAPSQNALLPGQSGATITECYQSGYTFFQGEEFSYLWKKPLFDDTHKLMYEYANGWTVDRDYILGHFSKDDYTLNPDGSIDINLVLYFRPQSWFYVGLGISGLTFLGLLLWLLWSYRTTNGTSVFSLISDENIKKIIQRYSGSPEKK